MLVLVANDEGDVLVRAADLLQHTTAHDLFPVGLLSLVAIELEDLPVDDRLCVLLAPRVVAPVSELEPIGDQVKCAQQLRLLVDLAAFQQRTLGLAARHGLGQLLLFFFYVDVLDVEAQYLYRPEDAQRGPTLLPAPLDGAHRVGHQRLDVWAAAKPSAFGGDRVPGHLDRFPVGPSGLRATVTRMAFDPDADRLVLGELLLALEIPEWNRKEPDPMYLWRQESIGMPELHPCYACDLTVFLAYRRIGLDHREEVDLFHALTMTRVTVIYEPIERIRRFVRGFPKGDVVAGTIDDARKLIEARTAEIEARSGSGRVGGVVGVKRCSLFTHYKASAAERPGQPMGDGIEAWQSFAAIR